ncbi:MAG: 3-isopropylmalate dehydratase small subunit [Acidobacteria bacterium]|nr:3-isopropylmalate dehydratase small subunit [Acidobacteriota bacterium]
MAVLRGKAHKYGDNIDTDVIIPARYCNSFREEDLAPHCLEDLDKEFVKKRQPGDFVVAGGNFGCGSSREQAPLAIKAAKVAGVIAESFARIFYRNAINIGLPIFESPDAAREIQAADEVEADTASGVIRNLTTGKTYRSAPYPEFLQQVLEAGGMVNYVRRRLGKS